MTDQQNPLEGTVHGVTETLERPPEPPPSGPAVWIRENLISGDTLVSQGLNGALSIVFILISLAALRSATGFFFSDERRWGAVTANMKLLMVQAFPQADLWRIWVSVGVFLVLLAVSLAAWGVGGRVSIHKLATGVRAAGVFLSIVAFMHAASGADIVNLVVLRIDAPGSWSGSRLGVFVLGLVLAVAGHLVRRSYQARKDETIPFLILPALGMVAITAVIWTIELPFPTGAFEEAPAPIARTTTGPWTILFAITILAYLVAKPLAAVAGDRMRRVLLVLWVFSYPVIIMVIQRDPILDWSDMLGFGETPFIQSDLGAFLLFGIVGAGLLWWAAWPHNRSTGRIVMGVVAVVLAVGVWMVPEAPAWVRVVATLAAVGLGPLAVVAVEDPTEMARLLGFMFAVLALLVWFVPMSFLYRALVITLAIFVVAAPTFGGTALGRTRIVVGWLIAALLIVAGFRLGIAETSLQFQSTTFLGGFNLTILLAITGVVLSFPLGAVLALARTSTMPIFRLLATGYIELVRSVPLITWLFFGSVMLALFLPRGVEFDEIVRIVAAVTIFSAAYVAENIRGGLQSINKGQYEAARAMGLSTVQSTTLIILPQAIRAVIPALVGSVIVAFKDTSLVAIIGLADVLWIARTAIPGQTSPFNFLGTQPQMMFFMALFYWVFTFTFSRLSLRYEKRLGLGER